MRLSRLLPVALPAVLAALAGLASCSSDDGAAADAAVPDDGKTAIDGGADVAVPDASDGAVDAADAADAADSGTKPVKGYSVVGELTFAFASPYALAVDSTDNVYVSEQTDAADTSTLYLTNRSFAGDIAPGHARILKFDKAGTYLGWIGAGSDATKGFHDAASVATALYGYDPGMFNMIRGMTFDAADHLYVLDSWRIQELDANHAFSRWAGYSFLGGYGWHVSGQPDSYAGPLVGGFTWPSGLRIHGGKLWVGNWFWNSPGFPNGDWNSISTLDLATGLGSGWLGGALNTSTAAQSAGYFDVGAPLQPRSSVAHSASPGVFSSPRHFVWHGDKIYVVDTTSDPVLSVFDEKGVMQPGKLAHLSGAAEKPFAVAVDRFGNVIISDMYEGTVRFFSTKLDASGEFTQVAQWQVDIPSVPNVTYPRISDFAWDSADNLYVAATTKDKVYKIRLSY